MKLVLFSLLIGTSAARYEDASPYLSQAHSGEESVNAWDVERFDPEDIHDDAWRAWGIASKEARERIIREGYYRPLCEGHGKEKSQFASQDRR